MKSKVSSQIILMILISTNILCADYRGTLLWNDSVDSHNIKYIPNVFYIGQGYNVMKANPQSTQGLDPGYLNIQAVDLTYNDNLWRNVNPDRSYFIPDGTSLTVQKSCTMSFIAKEVTSLQEYTQNLEASVAIKGSYFGGKFRASVDYKEVESGMSSNQMQFIVSKATCAVFQLGLLDSPNLHPLLSDNIAIDLKKLIVYTNNTNNVEANAYYDFFDLWGTHVVTSLKLGSLFGYRFQMKKSDVQAMKNQGIDVSASASYFNVRGRANTQIEENNKNQFTAAIQNWTSYSIGATPDENNDPAKWATQTLNKPMPIQSQITPYHDVINSLTQRDAKGLSSSDILKLTMKLRFYSSKYCTERLLARQKISQCKPNPDADFNNQQQYKIDTYSDIALLDISRNLISAYYKDSITQTTQIKLQDIQVNFPTIKFTFANKVTIINGQTLGKYQQIIDNSGQCLIGNPTEGAFAKMGPCSQSGDNSLFNYVAYDDNIFSLNFKSNPNLGLGFDESGILKTMNVNSCFECQIFQIKSNYS